VNYDRAGDIRELRDMLETHDAAVNAEEYLTPVSRTA